jgi:hypothetical protein
MLWVPQKGAVKVITNQGIVGSNTPGTAVPCNASTTLDGAVTEIISAANNTQNSWGISIWISETGASATIAQAAMDILIGGATDDVLISALLCGYARAAGQGGYAWFFPLHIPAGVRIAARFASVRTGISARCIIKLYGGGPPPFRVGRKVTTYGTQVNNVRGQTVVPATSGGAATATQLTAATSEDHFAFLPGFQPETDSTLGQSGLSIGIGIGASVEERIGTWEFISLGNEDCTGPLDFPLPAFRDVPAGTRLTMLASNSAASNDDAYGGLIYAVS